MCQYCVTISNRRLAYILSLQAWAAKDSWPRLLWCNVWQWCDAIDFTKLHTPEHTEMTDDQLLLSDIDLCYASCAQVRLSKSVELTLVRRPLRTTPQMRWIYKMYNQASRKSVLREFILILSCASGPLSLMQITICLSSWATILQTVPLK